MIVDLKQGSPEWLTWRKSHITGTDASCIMGDNPWKSAYMLWQEKLGFKDGPIMNKAMQRGIDLEPIARSFAESSLGIEFIPVVMQHQEHEWMGASLDGLSKDGKIALEIKCPKKEVHQMALNGSIPRYYLPQTAHVLEVSGAEKLMYFSYCPEIESDQFAIVEVLKDKSYNDLMISKEKDFFKCLSTYCPPELTENDYIEMESDEWEKLAKRYVSLKRLLTDYEKEEKETRNRLIDISGKSNAKGAGLRLSKVIRRGTVDYDAVLKHYNIDVDLDQFRKPTTESWRITV